METLLMNRLALAKAYKEKRDYDSAIKELKKILSRQPINVESHLLLGLIYQEKMQYDLALGEFKIALELDPDNSSVFTLIGNIHNLQGNHSLAEREYRRAIDLKAKNRAEAHFELGRIYENQERYDQAIKEYEISLELEYKKDSLLRLIQLYRFIGRCEFIEKRVLDGLKSVPEEDLFFRNILLNELEMAQQRTVLSSKIRSFTITMTNRCNLNCLACEARRYTWEMPRKTIKEIMEFFPYLEYIMWQGGEVFLVDYFNDILEETKRYPNIKQLIVTNGMLFSEDLIERLVLLPAMVLAISVDGVTKDVYESIRRGAKFEKLIENIKLINLMRRQHNSSMYLHLNVTVMKSNYHQLLDFVEFAKEYGFSSVLLRSVQGNFDSQEKIFNNRDEEALNQIAKMIVEVENRARRYKIALDNRIPVPGLPYPEKMQEKTIDVENRNKKLLCYAPWQRLYVSWDGNVYPDCMCVWPYDMGIANVKRASIEDIWNNEGMQLYRKKIRDNDYMDICSPDCIAGNIPERYLKFNR